MIWSFSEGRLFRKCQRQWYYKAKLANALAKDPLRREAYLLGKLQSINAWRGKVVDQVIEKVIIPAVKTKSEITLMSVVHAARKAFDIQLDFALKHRIREPGFKACQHGDDLAAFREIEYGVPPTQADIDKAWSEILTALTTLFQSPQFVELRAMIKSAYRLTAQCVITFEHAGATVKAVPDLICFFKDAEPSIIDWKVHHFGVHDYYQQLVCYAIALTRCKSHKALPDDLRNYPTHNLNLLEAQLLTGEVRSHAITEDDVEAVEDRMAGEIQEMLLAVDGRGNSELTAEDLPVTNRIGVCATCNYKKLCWRSSL